MDRNVPDQLGVHFVPQLAPCMPGVRIPRKCVHLFTFAGLRVDLLARLGAQLLDFQPVPAHGNGIVRPVALGLAVNCAPSGISGNGVEFRGEWMARLQRAMRQTQFLEQLMVEVAVVEDLRVVLAGLPILPCTH